MKLVKYKRKFSPELKQSLYNSIFCCQAIMNKMPCEVTNVEFLDENTIKCVLKMSENILECCKMLTDIEDPLIEKLEKHVENLKFMVYKELENKL